MPNFDLATLITGGLSGLGQLGLGIAGLAQADQRNKWEQHVQQETWNREDTAYQRAVNDASQAGFSPLVAAGTSAGQAGTVVDTSASAGMYDTANARMSDAFSTLGQVSQFLHSQIQARDIAADDREVDKINADANLMRAETERDYYAGLDQREEGIYALNRKYAKEHNMPYGTYQQSDRFERIAEGLADYIMGENGNGYTKLIESIFGDIDSAPWIFRVISKSFRDSMHDPIPEAQSQLILDALRQTYGADATVSADGKINGEEPDFDKVADDMHKVYEATVAQYRDMLATHKINREDYDKLVDKAMLMLDMSPKQIEKALNSASSH